MIRRGKKLFVPFAPNSNPFLQIAHRHSGVTGLVIARVPHRGEQRYQAAMAPADHSDSLRINFAVSLQHELASRVDVFDFQAAVIDGPPEFDAITTAAAVIRRDDGISLLEQFADDDAKIIGSDIPMNFRMS